MAEGKKTSIGTENYFDNLNRETVFEKQKIAGDYKSYSEFMKRIVRNASDALAQIYSDIHSNIRTIKFLDSSSLDRVKELVENLDDLHRLTSDSARVSADSIKSLINNNCPRNSYYIPDIVRASEEIIKNNPLKLSERESKELIAKALNYGTSAGNNEEQKEYIDALFRKYDKDMISVMLDYLSCDRYYVNEGKIGGIIGSSYYVEAYISKVFSHFSIQPSSLDSVKRNLRDGVNRQIEMLVRKIREDIRDAINSYEYMDYTTRCFMLDLVKDMAQYTSSSYASGFENDLLKLRRLEDFNNKVIEINKIGYRYPVDVELIWENGKNKLKISARVCFPFFSGGMYERFISDKEKEIIERRKTIALDGFRQWGKETPFAVFGDQNVIVSVDVQEVNSENDAVLVYLANDASYLGPMNTSMSWGGKGIYDWSPTGGKEIFLRYQEAEEKYQQDTAMHEFGHSLGLGDAYGSSVFGPGVDYSLLPDAKDTVMDYQYNKRPTNNDIEMVILAFSTGKRQNFQKQFKWSNISEALGVGN